MLDLTAETQQDPRAELVICAYDADEGSWLPNDYLSGEPWGPAGARAVAVNADRPETLAQTLSECLKDQRCRGLLLVGRTRRSDAFRLQIRAENLDLDGKSRLDRTGPSSARATAPAAEIVRALAEAGLRADASSETEPDTGSYLLYRILVALSEQVDAPYVALLRAPMDSEAQTLSRGVRAAASAMTRNLAPRARH